MMILEARRVEIASDTRTKYNGGDVVPPKDVI